MEGAPMADKEADPKKTQAARDKLKNAERGEVSNADELERMGTSDWSSTASVEQEVSDGGSRAKPVA